MKNIKRTILLVFVLLLTSFVFIAPGQQKVMPPPESDRTSSNRDFLKFLARVEVGPAYGQHTISSDMAEFIVSGLAFPMDVQLGIGIFPKTYLHGAFGVTILDRPTYTFDNTDYTVEGTYVMFDVGLGITVYPFPQKVYGSATIYGTTMTSFVEEEVYNSEIGFAFNLKGGVDFMLGSVFSLGTSAFLYYASMKDQPDSYGNQAQIKNFVIGICLTATLGNL